MRSPAHTAAAIPIFSSPATPIALPTNSISPRHRLRIRDTDLLTTRTTTAPSRPRPTPPSAARTHHLPHTNYTPTAPPPSRPTSPCIPTPTHDTHHDPPIVPTSSASRHTYPTTQHQTLCCAPPPSPHTCSAYCAASISTHLPSQNTLIPPHTSPPHHLPLIAAAYTQLPPHPFPPTLPKPPNHNSPPRVPAVSHLPNTHTPTHQTHNTPRPKTRPPPNPPPRHKENRLTRVPFIQLACWESLRRRLRRAATACARVAAGVVGPSIRSSPI